MVPVDVHVEEVDDVAEAEAVYEVADDAADDEAEGELSAGVFKFELFSEYEECN